jgi:hypothetical protein
MGLIQLTILLSTNTMVLSTLPALSLSLFSLCAGLSLITSGVSKGWRHKVHIYLEYHSFCPSLELGPPPPSTASECDSPRAQIGGGGGYTVHTCQRVRGLGSPNSDDWRESLVLCLLCGWRQRQILLLYLFLFRSLYICILYSVQPLWHADWALFL